MVGVSGVEAADIDGSPLGSLVPWPGVRVAVLVKLVPEVTLVKSLVT